MNMNWTITKRDEEAILNSFASPSVSEVRQGVITMPSAHYHIVPNAEIVISHSNLLLVATTRYTHQGLMWQAISSTNQIEPDSDLPVEQLAWDDVEGLKALALEFKDEELKLVNAARPAFAKLLEKLDNE